MPAEPPPNDHAQTQPNLLQRLGGWGLIPLLLAFLVALVLVTATENIPEGTVHVSDAVWHMDVEQTMAQAPEDGRPVLMMFTASWCGPCQMLKHQVLNEPDIEAMLTERVQPVYADVTSENPENQAAALAWQARLNIQAYPTLMLLTPQGQPIDAVMGVVSKASFEAWLDRHAPAISQKGNSQTLSEKADA